MVFSGIVETRGRITSVIPRGAGGCEEGITLNIEPLLAYFLLQDISLGCSIAVNGTCLTVTKFDEKSFSVDLAPETLRKTSFGDILAGSFVNLEKAMKNSDRNSGHTVQGHIDGRGKIVSVHADGVSLVVKISTLEMSSDSSTRRYFNSLIVPKGFIAVDGASLTVCEVNKRESWFTLMLIPHTQEVLKPWEVNDYVNIELDCLAKYVCSTVGDLHDRVRRLEIVTLPMSLNGWGYFYLAGAIDDGRWKHAPVTVQAAREGKFVGSVAEFIQQFPKLVSHMSNTVKVCPLCEKSCGYSLQYCNNCGGSIEDEKVTRSDNALMGFVYGISTLETSIRHQCNSFLVYDDLMQTTVIHLNAIPTTVHIPDFRYLFSQPKRGLDLIRSLYEKANLAASSMLANKEFVSRFYSPKAQAEMESIPRFVDKHVLCGFNFPPSQCQLHLQFIMPPYMPYHAVLQAEGKHADMNRFFPFEYIVKVLETLVFSNKSISLSEIDNMSGIDLIGYVERNFRLNYYHYYHEAVADNHEHAAFCSNWNPSDFKYIVVNKTQVISTTSNGECTDKPFALVESDKRCLQSYGKRLDGSTQLQYYSFAKVPGEVQDWIS